MRSVFLVICLLATIIVCIQGTPRSTRNDVFMNNLADCKKKVDASDADVDIIKNRQKLTTKGSQCLMACIKKKLGLMLEDNTINLSASKEGLEVLKGPNKRLYDQLVKTLEICKEKETLEKDECVAAKKFSDCIIEIREKEKLYD